MAGDGEDRVFEVEDDGTVVPLFGPAPLWLRILTGVAGIAVWAGLALAVFGGAIAVGGALSWDWMWGGAWLALGGFAIVWIADRALPRIGPPRVGEGAMAILGQEDRGWPPRRPDNCIAFPRRGDEG